MSLTSYYGHGKLLITGEYLVMKGAEALAVPLRLGQHFAIKKARGADLHWKALRPDGSEWFKGVFSLLDFNAQEASDPEFAAGISRVLQAIARQNPDFLSDWKGQSVESRLEFEPEWGLGSSSTLLYAMAEWGEVNPYTLLERTFGGSGYDLACASADSPLLFQSTDEEIRITPLSLEWPFKDHLRLVWSGRKESSRQSIHDHQARLDKVSAADISAITALSNTVADAESLADFTQALAAHNERLAALLGREANPWAPDFPGLVKPLGAWGGDFFLAVSPEDPAEMQAWWQARGFTTQFAWTDLVREE